MIGIFPDKAQIMTDQENSHVMGLFQIQERIQEHFEAVAVNAADGLIQHEQVRRRIHGQGQEDALQFTAGTAAQGPVRQFSGMDGSQGLLHSRTGLFAHAGPDRTPGKGGGHEIPYGQGHFPVKLQMLGNIAGAQMRNIQSAAVHMADQAGMGNLPQQGADQGGFAGTVLADQDSELSAMDVHGHILKQGLAAATDGDPVQIDVTKLAVMQGH